MKPTLTLVAVLLVIGVSAEAGEARLLVAALAWTLAGGGMLIAGVHWSLTSPPGRASLVMAAAAATGWAKERFVLRRRAEQNAERILASNDGRCLGGAFSWPAWLFVAAMAAAGATLRHSPVSRILLGFVYVAVGVALLLGSAVSWRCWARLRGSPASTAT